jgi:putative transcriptional regulator
MIWTGGFSVFSASATPRIFIPHVSCVRWNMVLSRYKGDRDITGTLAGQMLVAMPGMSDDRFRRSVIYICAHSDKGAMGIVINHRTPRMTFRDLLVQLDVLEPDQAIRLPRRISHAHVLKGGPVETSRGFVLHTADYSVGTATQDISDGICMTATLDILTAMAKEEGPKSAVMALGYSGWGPGQLERELSANGWLHCAGDHELVFSEDIETTYDKALRKIGIDPAMLSTETGHA